MCSLLFFICHQKKVLRFLAKSFLFHKKNALFCFLSRYHFQKLSFLVRCFKILRNWKSNNYAVKWLAWIINCKFLNYSKNSLNKRFSQLGNYFWVFLFEEKCSLLWIFRFLCFAWIHKLPNPWRHHRHYCIKEVTFLVVF